MFESNYIQYQKILSGECTDINLIMNSHSIYDILKKEAISIYDTVQDKDKWLKSEILSLIDNKIYIPLNFNLEFKNIYLNSFLRFDLINEYLKNKNLEFDITSDLNLVVEKSSENGKLYKVLHILFIMITNSITDESTFAFIEKLLYIYNKNNSFEDKTLIYDISDFIESKYSFNKLNYLKTKFPLIW
ncbi:hypothetical protein ACM39_12945 [Chryseobacterium sp. FH2]|uniref:hypothetical protein n=1 Tax=Chryseobacterium sp. FH2 TaxID=1674291 RepID=UPI00065AE943|nr:hypothetical protein [Chryseobacterium sp. FH2]KMQ67739.1 hypothetical protein ACM39_12945 [Chryseobacterium sp. FH2]